MNFENHPIAHIKSFIRTQPDTELEFSIYRHHPQSIFDSRSLIKIKASELSETWLRALISDLKQNEELAFHSKIKVGKSNFHIPLIDLSCPASDIDEAKAALSKVLPNGILSGLVFYDSGRSMHAYFSRRVQKNKWIEFMGRLLLANFPLEKDIVDSRWVGHRLMGGFSSLRWSSNSGNYLKPPTIIK